MIFETLQEASERGELMLVDGGFCNWHLRRDGQLTIREIISTRKGAGSQMLRRLEHTLGATSLFAKCPVRLSANNWYTHKGFHVERMEITRRGSKLLHWRKWLQWQPVKNGGKIELIYCAGNNKDFAQMAIDAGWYVGHRDTDMPYFRPYFMDQDWKNPDLDSYMARLEKYRPYMATVLDWEYEHQFNEVMCWAEGASQFVNEIIIIPKVPGTIHKIPETIDGKPVRLGYSVPTRHGGTTVQVAEFGTRSVHLLGGAPHVQMELANVLNVVSADTNYHQKLATKNSQFWVSRPGRYQNAHFPTLREIGELVEWNAPTEAMQRSLRNIIAAWRGRAVKPQHKLDLQLSLAI